MFVQVVRLLLAISLCTSVLTIFVNPDEENEVEFRLPNDTRPLSYDIHFYTKVHQCDQNFSGNVVIRLMAINDTDKIVVHAVSLDQMKIHLVDATDESEIENVTFSYNNVTNLLTVHGDTTPLELKAGREYALTLAYKGIHRDYPSGFFMATYYDAKSDQDVCIAASDFEPINAREAFPCYDEPAFKAKFTVSITHGANLTALSAMPVDGTPLNRKDGMVTTKFKTSPLMSTYYVAFALVNYDRVCGKQSNITQCVYVPAASDENGDYALDVAMKTLKTYEDYFGIAYPLPKIDHISVPDRHGRAMENWGLIIYQRGWLLPSSNASNLFNFGVSLVMVHELGHQWFGNLVSPKWWTYTWLNEGLTTFYSHKAMQIMYPDLDISDFVMILELGPTEWHYPIGRPLSSHANSERAILEKFGYVSYYKAAYILHMFENALTEETFKKGVINYLKKFQFSVADEDDFFDHLQEAATEDKVQFFEEEGSVKKIMKPWTNQGGHPLVTVEREYRTGTLKLTQKMFHTNDTDPDELTSYDLLWYIPITYATAQNANFDDTTTDFIFPMAETFTVALNESILGPSDWIILNKNQVGNYRVNYDETNWKLITKTLKENRETIPPLTRAQLFRDAFTLGHQDLVSDDILVELLVYLKNEDEGSVWLEALTTLLKIVREIEGAGGATTAIFKYFARDIGSVIVEKIGVRPKPDDDLLTEQVRPLLMMTLCKVDAELCKTLIEPLFNEIIEERKDLESTMKQFIYCEGFKSLTPDRFEIALNRFEKEQSRREQAYLGGSLLCSKNKELIKEATMMINNTTSPSWKKFLRRFL